MEFYQMEGMDYLIRKPSCFDEKRKYPVILLLHGSGSRGRDIQMLLKNPFYHYCKNGSAVCYRSSAMLGRFVV